LDNIGAFEASLRAVETERKHAAMRAAPGQTIDAKVASYQNAVDDGAPALIAEAVSTNAVVVFSKSWCPHCRRGKTYLAQGGDKAPKTFELDKRQDGTELQEALASMTGQETVPAIFIEGKFIGGADDVQKLLPGGALKKRVQMAHANLHIKHRYDTPVHAASISTSSFEMGMFGEADNYFCLDNSGGSSNSSSVHSRSPKPSAPAKRTPPPVLHFAVAGSASVAQSPTRGGARRGW
jgi:glutaredoxin 3